MLDSRAFDLKLPLGPYLDLQSTQNNCTYPGKPVAYNYGLLWLLYGLLWGIVAYYYGLLGVPGTLCFGIKAILLGTLEVQVVALHEVPAARSELGANPATSCYPEAPK